MGILFLRYTKRSRRVYRCDVVKGVKSLFCSVMDLRDVGISAWQAGFNKTEPTVHDVHAEYVSEQHTGRQKRRKKRGIGEVTALAPLCCKGDVVEYSSDAAQRLRRTLEKKSR